MPSADAYVPTIEGAADSASPEEVLEGAAACVRFVASVVKVPPDFSPETLPLLDHYVRESRAALQERPEALAITVRAIGAYLGEVVRRSHRCWWRLDTADPGAWRLEFERVKLCFYPVQVAYSALTLDANEDQFAGFEIEDEHHDAVSTRLGELPNVSDEEYFAPSTRLEVLDIVADAVAARTLSAVAANRHLSPLDYQ